MEHRRYEVTESVAELDEGDVLVVTARFGHYHTVDMTLERSSFADEPTTVVVTDEPTGFSERNVLDETTRVGDWHEYDLTFDAGESVERALASAGPAELTTEDLRSIAEPVGEAA